MIIDCVSVDTVPDNIGAIGLPVVSSPEGPQLFAGISADITDVGIPSALDAPWCEQQGFTGKVGQALMLHSVAAATAKLSEPELGEGSLSEVPLSPSIVLVGLGEAHEVDGHRGLETLRRAAAAFVRAVGEGHAAALVVPRSQTLSLPAVAGALAEGAALAAYRFDAYRTGKRPESLQHLSIITQSPAEASEASAGVVRGTRIAQSVSLARDLVNEPPSSLTPERLAETFVQRFRDSSTLSIEVWDHDRIVAERLGGLLGVARGSAQRPKLIRVEYEPTNPLTVDGRVPHVVLVGKGITFDSGGLSLKTASGMETMKTDMGGAAAVLGAIDAAAALSARIRISAITPLTENMPGGAATKPGDVLTIRNGKTIEVLNTDAEGRLVLADALSLAAEMHPDAIIDLATLTGAAVVALGKEIAALLGNDQGLLDALREASSQAGESLWELPLPADYHAHIESEIADMKNVGRAGQAGSISAALLLQEFVDGVPWAHLDIAGPARSDENSRYFTKGGTGFGVRTLVALITSDAFGRAIVGAP